MPDSLTPQQRHKCMAHIRSKNTKPEVRLRRELFKLGYRYRINVTDLPGKPDIVLPIYRTIIFVNGCFWHGHNGCRYYTVPKTNVEFWIDKVSRNKERDALNNQCLESLSWNIVTIWECELRGKSIDSTIGRIVSELNNNKEKWEQYQLCRRTNREFVRAEIKRKREILERVKKELHEMFNTQKMILKPQIHHDH